MLHEVLRKQAKREAYRKVLAWALLKARGAEKKEKEYQLEPHKHFIQGQWSAYDDACIVLRDYLEDLE